jgi:hypothetical protein
MFSSPNYRLVREKVSTVFANLNSTDAEMPAKALDLANALFSGEHPGFEACDTAFHDFDHTLEAGLALLELIQAQRRKNVVLRLTPHQELLAFVATLFHDSGYIKRKGDLAGSGAKFSNTHVGRGVFIAWDLLDGFRLNSTDLRLVQNSILATATTAVPETLGFRSQAERFAAGLVATGDILGQFAAEDYPVRLPGLYLEFREAALYSRLQAGGPAAYRTLMDLFSATNDFCRSYIRSVLDDNWGGLYHLLDEPNGRNRYMEQIETNLQRVQRMSSLLTRSENQGRPDLRKLD